MVFAAIDAINLTTNAIILTDNTDLQTEVSLVEDRVRSASSLGIFVITYNAAIIGNPSVDPRSTIDLPQIQLDFFNLFSTAGYVVGLDIATGHWFFSWAASGAEQLVSIYSFRTSIDPTAVVANTQSVIAAYFESINPVVHSRSTYNGFIDEAGFGATSSPYYEFTVVVDQEGDHINHSGGLKVFLTNAGLGYNSGNCNVYQLVI